MELGLRIPIISPLPTFRPRPPMLNDAANAVAFGWRACASSLSRGYEQLRWPLGLALRPPATFASVCAVYSIGSKYAGLTLASSNRGTPAYPRRDVLLLTNARPLLQPGPEAQDAAAGVRATSAAPATGAGCEPTPVHLASASSAQSPPHAPA